MSDFWIQNSNNFPELKDIKQWLDDGNENDFFESIVKQANNRILSDRQIESAQKGFDKIMNPAKRIEFDELEKKAYVIILNHLSLISPMGYDFYNSISMQISSKKYLSEKQWESVKRKFYRFRKSLLRTIFTGSTQK